MEVGLSALAMMSVYEPMLIFLRMRTVIAHRTTTRSAINANRTLRIARILKWAIHSLIWTTTRRELNTHFPYEEEGDHFCSRKEKIFAPYSFCLSFSLKFRSYHCPVKVTVPLFFCENTSGWKFRISEGFWTKSRKSHRTPLPRTFSVVLNVLWLCCSVVCCVCELLMLIHHWVAQTCTSCS